MGRCCILTWCVIFGTFFFLSFEISLCWFGWILQGRLTAPPESRLRHEVLPGLQSFPEDEQVSHWFLSCVYSAAVNYQAQFIASFKHLEADTLNSFFGGGGCSLWLTFLYFFEFIFWMCNLSGDLLVFLPTVEQGVVLSKQHLGRARLCSCLERLHRCSLWAFRRGTTVHYFQFDRNHVFENLWSELYGLHNEAVNLKE